MKSLLKKLIATFQLPVDLLLLLFVAPSAMILKTYRKIGSARVPLTTRSLKLMGVFPIRDHYYEPLFNDAHLKQPLTQDRFLPGIDLNVPGQMAFLKSLVYAEELVAADWGSQTQKIEDFYVGNPSYGSGDAEFLYQFLRAIKPSKVIEIGSGNSTKVARLALLQNAAETKQNSFHICIEPYEMQWLSQLENVTVIRKRIEDCEFNWPTELHAGDVLFIDSSHMIRPQGDVLLEYLEILPQLASGVYVHIHDIFTPKDYLESWVIDDVRLWNEQYLLETLLSNTTRYEVIGALNYLKNNHYDHLKAICPYLTEDREPGAFYLRIR